MIELIERYCAKPWIGIFTEEHWNTYVYNTLTTSLIKHMTEIPLD